MLLESGKIYKTYIANRLKMCPSIELRGDVSFYVSDKGIKPNSINEMELINNVRQNYINSILAQTRWIAVVYNTDESAAYEMGIVTNPFLSSISTPYVPQEEQIVIDDKGTIVLAGTNFYLYW